MARSFLVTVTNDLNQDQRMHRICSTLANNGHEVLLIGRVKKNSTALFDHSFEQKRLHCFFNKGFLFYLEYNIRLLILALRQRPDVIYAVDLDTLLAGGLASRLMKNKLIHDAHEYFVEVPELEGKAMKKSIWNRIGNRFIPSCDLCITVNQELAEILSKKYKNDFQVIRSVPKTTKEIKQKKSPGGTKIIMYQGVLNKGRGLEEAITAVSQMEMDVVLNIAGEGDLSKELRTLVKELGAENKVNFLGWLSPDQLKIATLKADVGLNLLSAKSLNYKYSLANKFFDYMHARVPSINMAFPVYKRICNEFEVGICIEDLNTDSIKEAIISLLSDADLMKRVELACERASERYNWETESEILIQLVDDHI